MSTTELNALDSLALQDESLDGYEVSDLRESGAPALSDWMTKLLMNKEFQMVPAKNLQAIFSKLTSVSYSAGDKVIEQGKPGEYFFIISAGRCAVTREMPQDRGDITLAELTVGDTFGEEALITGAKRAATITMLSDGAVMRLTKEDFCSLLSEPIVTTVDAAAGKGIVDAGGKWLNVGFAKDSPSDAQQNTVQIPMPLLRLKLDRLDAACHYVVTSDNVDHSRAGAHILRQQGFEVSVLVD